MPRWERWRVQPDLTIRQTVDRLITTIAAALTPLSPPEPGKPLIPLLMQLLPGCAVVTSMTLRAASGDSTRFPAAKKRVGYSGLGARGPASGQTDPTGPMTKQGRRELRTVRVARGVERGGPSSPLA